MKTFRLHLVSSPIPNMSQISVSSVEVKPSVLLERGLVPQGEIGPREQLDKKLWKVLDDWDSYPECINSGDSDLLKACGQRAGRRSSAWRTAADMEYALHNLRLVDSTWSYDKLMSVVFDWVKDNWNANTAHDLHSEKFEPHRLDFADQRALYKRLFPGIIIKGYDDIYRLDLANLHSPEDFEADAHLLLEQYTRKQGIVLRSTNVLKKLTDEDAHLKLIDKVSQVRLLLRNVPGGFQATYNTADKSLRCIPDMNRTFSTERDTKRLESLGITGSDRGRFRITDEALDRANANGDVSLSGIVKTYDTTKTRLSLVSTIETSSVECEDLVIDCCCLRLPYSIDSEARHLVSLAKAAKIAHSGSKDKVVTRLAAGVVRHLAFRKEAFDDFFSEPWIHMKGGPGRNRRGFNRRPFPIEDASQALDEYALAVYILGHMKGGRILHQDHEDELFEAEDMAKALFLRTAPSLGVFSKI